MALDPSITLQAGHGVTPLENPMDQGMKALNMQQAMRQNQMAEMDFQDQQRIRQLAQTGQYQTPDALADAAMKAGVSPKTTMAMKMQGADYQAKVASTAQALATAAQRGGAAAKERMDLIAKGAEEGRTLAFTAKTPEEWQAGLARIDEKYGPAGVPSLAAKYGNFTPESVNALAINGATMADAHAAAFGQNMSTPAGVVNIKQPLTPGSQPEVKQLVAGQPHPGIGPDGKPGFFQLDATGKVPDGWKPVPNAASIMVGGGGLTPEALQMLVDKYKATGQIDGDIGRNQVLRAKIVNAAAADGPVDLAGAKQDYASTKKGKADFEPNGTSGKTISAINTMTEHLATARRMAEALQNGQFPIANQLGQSLGVQLGDNPATNFATIKQFLAGEVAKVATGGHLTEGEIHAAADRLNQAQSPAQLMGALDTMREVAGGKLIALNQDYKRLFGKSLDETGRLTPATKAAFQGVNAAHGGSTPGGTVKQFADEKGVLHNFKLSADGKSWEKI